MEQISRVVDTGPVKAPYTKPSIIARLCGGLVDLLLTVGTTMALFATILATPLGNNLKSYQNEMTLIQEKYGWNSNKSTSKTSSALENSSTESSSSRIPFKEWSKEDQKKYQDVRFKFTLNQYVYIVGSALLLELVFYFLIPLLNKRRATIGMFLAGTDLITMKYYGKPKWYHLLGRWATIGFLGTALPYYFIGELTALLVPFVVVLIYMVNGKTNRTLHDIFSGTIIVMNENTLKRLQAKREERNLRLED